MQKLISINRILADEYRRHDAPIIELIKASTNDPFKVLVSTILSARTRDQVTAEVSARLFRVVNKPDDLRKLGRKKIEKLIYPTGFFREKAKHLFKLPSVLKKEFNGKIPRDIDGLCRLPGVGRKTANLVLSVAFNKPAICVDIHVHRISNRLGLIRTANPFQTEMALRKKLPEKYWKTWNRYLVSYGQRVCTPRNPKCGECRLNRLCRKKG